jgi:polyisoprenoid-binding protein YceI
MKNWSKVVLTVALGLTLATGALAEWKPVKLDTVHSRIGFTASTLLFDVDGHFGKYELQLDGDPAKLNEAKVTLSIDAATIDTDNAKRDEHLSSPDFLDVKKYPKITFVSESIAPSGNTVNVAGTLDLHGQKKKVTIPFKMVRGKNGAGMDTTAFKGKLTINRNDFGVGAGSVAAKISLENEVSIDLLIVSFL